MLFLRIPPFPGARCRTFITGPTSTSLNDGQCLELINLLRQERVGGDFWAPKLSLPSGRDIVLAPSDRQQAEQMARTAVAEKLDHRSILIGQVDFSRLGPQLPVIEGPFDPWHLAALADQLWVGGENELALVAAMQSKPVRIFGDGGFAPLSSDGALAAAVDRTIGALQYENPFDGGRMTAFDAVRLLGDWRRLIDANQQIAAAFGIAAWKRPTVDPLLWDGDSGPDHARRLPAWTSEKPKIAVWKSRTSPSLMREIERDQRVVAEIEDGMIRGHGLGANCIPPLSIVLDWAGIYFDPSQASDLENLLQSAEFSPELLDRAANLRRRIVDAGISKYGGDGTDRGTRSEGRRVLVVGQVEDDRSILSGGKGQTNLELLQSARSMEPDAWLVYRPHPDIEAGHRKGHIADNEVLRHANEIDRGGSIIDLIMTVDEVHCITSLAGFEALLRGKAVTAHGVPFYAGWGLTRDLGEVPDRRTRNRTLDELVAASLILYPRYLDPITGLPCPAEVLVERIAQGEERIAAPLAGIRKMQGKFRRAIRRVRESVA